MLFDILTESAIQTNVICKDKDHAIRESGHLLVVNGHATDTYVDAMVESFQLHGPYIVIAPGIAMPHARPEDGAIDVGLSLVTLGQSIQFGHSTNDPVQLVIGLCAVDHERHLSILSELVNLLSNDEIVSKILKASSPSEVVNILKGGI